MANGKRWGIVALVAVVVAVLAPAPARAEKATWHRAACDSGSIDSVEVTRKGLALLTISGHLDCRIADKAARFGYARYETPVTWGKMRPTDLRRYRHRAPTSFSEGRLVADGPVSFSICVVTDYDVRVDCVHVSRDGSDAPLEVVTSAEKEIEFSRPVRVIGDYRPACGGCW